MGALSCSSFSAPHLHFALHRDSSVGGSGTGGSCGGNAVVPEPMDGVEDLKQGVIITSTSSGQPPKCGDGLCNGTETTATCPGDCPACTSIPPTGRIVDDSESLCFTQGGSPTYWHQESAGHLNTLYWTYATADAAADNNASWQLTFDEAGDYQVEAFITTAFAQAQKAKYTISHASQQSAVVLDQSAQGGWRDLGTFAFAVGGRQSVRLDDNTGEAVSLKRQLVFDAIRLTRVGGSAGSGGASGTGGAAGAAQGGGAGASAGGAAGGAVGTGGQSGAGASSSGGSSAGGTEPADDSGCGCRASPRGMGATWLFALAAVLGLARRRRSSSARRG
jgi:MYXO-CTERM domain-containing protein